MKKMNNALPDHLINAIIALALIAIVLSIMSCGCSTLPPADGPDAPQVRDSSGHPNYGTK